MTETPALKRAKDAGYGPCDDNGCCWHCQHSRTTPSGKFVCDVLNAQVLKGYGCRLFAYKKEREQ